jgi:EmrB/QacA subfamily drug resistance transporter
MPEVRSAATTVETRRWWVLAVMSVGTLLVFLDDTVVNTALPRISVDLHASTSELQWVIDAYVLTLAGLLLLCGSIGDRYGRKRMMTVGLVVFGVAAAGAALSDDIGVLIAMRAFQGLGAALVLPATLSIIVNVFPRQERAKAIAVWTAVGGLGIALGPVAGGWLIETAGWSAAFWLFIPLVVAALAGMTIVPESRDPRGVGLDVPGAVLGTAGLTALVYGIIRAGEVSWGDETVLVAFAIAAVLLVGFALVEARASAPMLPMRFLRERDLVGAVLLIGVVLFAMFVTFFFLTQYFQIVQGRSPLEAGLLLVAPAIGMIVGSGLAGKLIHSVGPRVLTTAMVLIVLAPVVVLASVLETTTNAGVIFVLLGFFGLGAGLGLPAMTDTVMAAVPERDAGVGSALNDVSRQLGGALGVAIIGSVVNRAYRSNFDQHVDRLPAAAARAAGEGIGIASRVAATLPSHQARELIRHADDAFVSAITRGLTISAVVLVGALVIALTLIPRRMRDAQAEAADGIDVAAAHQGIGELARSQPAATRLARHAVIGTVEIDAQRIDEGIDLFTSFAIPNAKDAPGFVSGTWYRSADDTRGHSVVLFDSDANARAAAKHLAQATPLGTPVRLVSVEVCEVEAEA